MNSAERYSGGAILLHWVMALLLAGELGLGMAMPRDASGFALYQLHKSIGLTLLFLTLLRIGWRLAHRPPRVLEGGAMGLLARGVHLGFYVLMLALPLSGWALVSTAEIKVPTIIFGLIPWPHLPLPDHLGETFEEVHEWLAWAALALFVLHLAGALRHHFLLRDHLLARMAPARSPGAALGLAALVIALGLGVLLGIEARFAGAAAAPPAAVVQEVEATPEPMATDEAVDEAVLEEELVPVAAETAEATGEPSAPPPQWAIAPGGSLRFSVDNAGSLLSGRFTRWSGQITMDPERPETAAIRIDVELASATLGDATQDEMLASADFFATAAYPVATWRSGTVRRVSANRYEADGTLSLKGVSRPQRISFTLTGSGRQRAVAGSASIDRSAFGVGTGANAEGLAPLVAVEFAFEAAAR